jgi:hypothetical protein
MSLVVITFDHLHCEFVSVRFVLSWTCVTQPGPVPFPPLFSTPSSNLLEGRQHPQQGHILVYQPKHRWWSCTVYLHTHTHTHIPPTHIPLSSYSLHSPQVPLPPFHLLCTSLRRPLLLTLTLSPHWHPFSYIPPRNKFSLYPLYLG